MVIGVFGESCTGKSTLADKLKAMLGSEVYSGKDYIRLSKSEMMAKKLFQQKLEEALNGGHVIYVISEKEQLPLLPAGAYRVLVTADLEIIKERFAQRMHGNLPVPVAAMLERKHGCFDAEPCDLHVVSGTDDPEAVCSAICSAVA